MTQKNIRHPLSQEARRKQQRIDQTLRPFRTKKGQLQELRADTLRITPLGGQNGIGEKNMIVVEYNHDAIVLDCGFELGIELPGINYGIPVTEYLESIKHKLRGYIISHGHMDHIGGLVHIVPDCPAPIYGSEFTIGMVNAQFEKARASGEHFEPVLTTLNMDQHEQLQLGVFGIELVRVTHSIPESSAIVINTPLGRLINTGDFRLDPEPLDTFPTDITRLRQLGDEGVLLMMSESTNARSPGRTPTEHSLRASFEELIGAATGRVFISIFSTNMNRVQMIVDAAVNSGRKVALDGRSMIATAELAVRLGRLKIPKGTFITMQQASSLPDNQLVVICTGGQGEPGAAMSKMAAGEHRTITLKPSDQVVISSTPIPGNERSYQTIGNALALLGVQLFRHPTHELDGCGPLHVSGHGNQDEAAEMMALTRPQYLMPIYGGALDRRYHQQIGLRSGMTEGQTIMVQNGEVIEIKTDKKLHYPGQVSSGTLLVDQTGQLVPEVVVQDRLTLEDDGFVVVICVVNRRTGTLISNPDIITRGAISIIDSSQLMEHLRLALRTALHKRIVSKTDTEQARLAIKQVTADLLVYDRQLSPLIIPVLKLVG